MLKDEEKKHEKYMRMAINEAVRGVKKGQSPFGAVIVDKKAGKVIAKAHNTVVMNNNPTAHAEVNAIIKAGKRLRRFHLKGCAIYTTCEPCPMCFSAVHWANLDELYYGAAIEDAERCGFREMKIPCSKMKRSGGKNVTVKIHKNVLRDDCARMMMDWKKSKNRKVYSIL